MVPSLADQLLPQLLMEQFDSFPIQCSHIGHMHEGVCFLYNVDTLDICMKEFGSEKIIFDKMTAVRTLTIFPNWSFCI